MSKESKRNYHSSSLKLPSTYSSREYNINIIPSTGTDEGEEAVQTRFQGAVSLLIVDCLD